MSDWNNDDDVGYGRPPKWTQFSKGKSGNPKGRPRKKSKAKEPPIDSELDAIQRKVLNQKVSVNVGGKTEQMPMQEAIVKAQATQAAKGNSVAQRDVLKRSEELEKREAARALATADAEHEEAARKAEGRRNLFKYLTDLKDSQATAWDLAEAEGRKEPDFPWPHPDDILLDHGRERFRVQGPLESECVPHFEWVRAERDVMFMRMMTNIRGRSKAAGAKVRFWSFMFWYYDALLPKRWKIADDFNMMVALHLQFSLTQLRKILAKGERKAEEWKVVSGNNKPCPEGYRLANTVLGPHLKQQGYRSLAQFERAYNDTGGNPPWPKAKSA